MTRVALLLSLFRDTTLERAGYRATLLQGSLSQYRCQDVLDGLCTGSFKISVATDIAARCTDVLDISHVINHDMPDCTDAHIHRIGRTGRIDKTGDAFTFVTNEAAGHGTRSLEPSGHATGAPHAARF